MEDNIERDRELMKLIQTAWQMGYEEGLILAGQTTSSSE